MLAEFISPDDPRWTGYLDVNWHDFYHLPEYVHLCARNEGGTPAAFYAETRGASFLAPLVIRSLPQSLNAPHEWSECASPYGYSTPLVSPTQELLPAFLDAFMRAAKDRGIVTAFFRLHPFSELNKKDLCRFGQLVHHGQTVYLDLSQSEDKFWTQVRRNHKQNIHKLTQLDFQVSFDDWSLLGEFAALYRATMVRVGAINCLYSEDYFTELKAILGSSMHLCCILSREGHLVAGGIFIETAGLVHYHLSATATEYMHLAPNKLIITFLRTWAQKRLNKVLHLGGGLGGKYDSLFHFKAGFSKARADFYSYRLIVDQHKYESLSRLAETLAGVAGSGPSTFFPAYRRSKSQAPDHRSEQTAGEADLVASIASLGQDA
jgi:hypothetical protein